MSHATNLHTKGSRGWSELCSRASHPVRGCFTTMGVRDLARNVALVVAAAAGFAAQACSLATRVDGSEPTAALFFENGTTDAVTVYLDHEGSRRILGHVEPGRQARLRIPGYGSLETLTEVRIIVVPLGANREGNRISTALGAICSEFEPTQHLVAMRWTLLGETLVSATFLHKPR